MEKPSRRAANGEPLRRTAPVAAQPLIITRAATKAQALGRSPRRELRTSVSAAIILFW